MICKDIVKRFDNYKLVACINYDKLFLSDGNGSSECIEFDEYLKLAQPRDAEKSQIRLEKRFSHYMQNNRLKYFLEGLYEVIDRYINAKKNS